MFSMAMESLLARSSLSWGPVCSSTRPVAFCGFQVVPLVALKGTGGAARPVAHQIQRPAPAVSRRRHHEQQLLQEFMQAPAAAAEFIPVKSFPGVSWKTAEPHKASSSFGSVRLRTLPRNKATMGLCEAEAPAVRPGSSRQHEAQLLVASAAEAAKLTTGSAAYWKGVAMRAVELADVLSAAEIALLLHALSRPGRRTGEEASSLLQGLAPRVEALMPHFSSLQLAQVLSAIARTQACGPSLLEGARRRVSRLLAAGELQQPFEVAMVLSASVKLRLVDAELLENLAAHVQRLLQRTDFPVRDLAVVAHAFASAACLHLEAFKCIADAALKGLQRATSLDLARLLQAFASAAAQCASWPAKDLQPGAAPAGTSPHATVHVPSQSQGGPARDGGVLPDKKAAFNAAHRRLFKACIDASGDRILFASPAELSVAAHAFGLALVESHGEDSKALAAVLQNIRSVAMTSLGLFLPQQLASLLLTFARWRLLFPPCDLIKVAERLAQLSLPHGKEAANSAAIAAESASGRLAWHPLFSPSSSAAPFDTASRISCLYSLGVLLRPCAAAVAACNTRSSEHFPASPNPSQASYCTRDTPAIQTKMAAPPTAVDAANAASKALAAGERLFEQWIEAIFFELSSHHRQRPHKEGNAALQDTPSGMGMQPVVRLAEALANCTFFTGTQRFVTPLQQLVVQRHRALDATSASKLLHHLRILGVPEDHDMLLLLQERAEQTPGETAAAGRHTASSSKGIAKTQPLIVHGRPAASG